jgi:dipeptidyl aminopeptidase/acylaminoacyl peptidase
MKYILSFLLIATALSTLAQDKMSPELLWTLGRVSGMGVSKDRQSVVYSVSTPNVADNKSSRKIYLVPVRGGTPVSINNADSLLNNPMVSPDGNYMLSSNDVKLQKVYGKDYYPNLPKSNVQVYTSLNYRHWDTWEDGAYQHIFLTLLRSGQPGETIDIMPNELYDAPQKPFGGEEDMVWSPDSKTVVYVCKKKTGKDYALSTNTDLYAYTVSTGETKNITEDNKGYDINPAFNTQGKLAWLRMKRDGYEADKQDLVIWDGNAVTNLTAGRDDLHVEGFVWSEDGSRLFFYAPVNGTLQLFEVAAFAGAAIRQITRGDFDINGITGQAGNKLIVSRTDMNHAAELYTADLKTGEMRQLTHVNDNTYNTITLSKVERRMVKTTDNKDMLVWVIYPPDFDPAKKYPTLLYCQGGPQSPLTQFYSFRWNMQLMAAKGYIVVAPNRRGMPGHGTKWNEQISKDWGGLVMKDYLAAIDALSTENYVDKKRLGCVGASFGGYSVFMLQSLHNGRFKTFISHDGMFDTKSWYGTTEELWFANFDMGGAYWDKSNAAAQKTNALFNPSNFVDKWNTPILIIQGGIDYRVPIEQGLQAFQAAQLKGIKSKLLYFPDENHWILRAQDAMVWQQEFYKWLEETL